jgi:hypothetical protein
MLQIKINTSSLIRKSISLSLILVLILVLALALFLFACIKPFIPEIEEENINKLVVSGRITGQEGWQEVNISTAAPVGLAEYLPVSGCEVTVQDDEGNQYLFKEVTSGSYRAWIGQEHLVPGTAYMVTVITPGGELIESAYDTLTVGATLDSVYYFIEDVATSDPGVFARRMQFYVDLNAIEYDARNYKWEIKETWEYHSARPLEFYYNGKFHEVRPPDYSKMICWTNTMVKEVFLVSTMNSSVNVVHKHPLHFIDGHTSRLSVLYSILVTQHSISESTYKYFEVVKSNSGGFGGLYEHQPFSIRGNLVNKTNPEKDVLGYFYACSESSKRYFYHDVEGIELDFWDQCNEGPLPLSGWAGFMKAQYPVYYYYNESGALRILNDDCVDCRVRGGTLTKPDFWPN